mgnify:CR=1 FL=1
MKTFKIGGICPPEYKLYASEKIKVAPLPKQAIISLSQHSGNPAIPVVKNGDTVKVGQLIAKADGFISSNIHSPFSGTVLKIEDALDVSGYKNPAIWIDVIGDEWDEKIDKTKTLNFTCSLDSKQIIKKIADCGVVGLGGASFPTHVKLTIPKDKKAEILIINAVECEPYLTSDYQLMLLKGKEIMYGIHILMKAVGVKETIIGIESNKKDVIDLFEKLATRFLGISVVALKYKYPQGGEKQLIESTLGRRVPSGKLPIDIGVVVQNVATAYAVYEAVQKNKPLIERVITVTGESLKKPINVLARIGTPFSGLIELVGGLPEDTGKIVAGGPMMGKALSDLEVPVIKGTSGLLIIPKTESVRKEVQNCTRCAKCINACPMGLEPYLLMTLAEHSLWDRMEKEHIMDCIECGCCLFTCPSNRPLLDYVRYGKQTVAKLIKNIN